MFFSPGWHHSYTISSCRLLHYCHNSGFPQGPQTANKAIRKDREEPFSNQSILVKFIALKLVTPYGSFKHFGTLKPKFTNVVNEIALNTYNLRQTQMWKSSQCSSQSHPFVMLVPLKCLQYKVFKGNTMHLKLILGKNEN